MTREEAIDELSVIYERLSHPEDCEMGCYSFRDGDYLEALDMAIEALSNNTTESTNEVIESQNDVIEVVRCKDCKWSESDHSDQDGYFCKHISHNKQWIVFSLCFCSYGERREP